MIKKSMGFILSAVFLQSCTGPVNNTTVKEMPIGYMCRILNSAEYISLPNEQLAIYSELEKRGETCVNETQRLIIKNE